MESISIGVHVMVAWTLLCVSMLVRKSMRTVLYWAAVQDRVEDWRDRKAEATRVESLPEFTLPVFGSTTRVSAGDIRNAGPTIMVMSLETLKEVTALTAREALSVFLRTSKSFYLIFAGTDEDYRKFYSTVMGDLDLAVVLIDTDRTLSRELKVMETPAAFLFDSNGRLVKRGWGFDGSGRVIEEEVA